MEDIMAWKDNVRNVVPYVPGEQPDSKNIIKLNTNENPYPPSENVKQVIKKLNFDSLKRYPNPEAADLVRALASYHDVERENVFVGVGSDDVLGMAFLTFFNSNKPILFPDITYSFYSVWADLYQIPYDRPSLDQELKLVKEDYKKENGGVIIPNPNAPTAVYEELENIEYILQQNKDVVVIIDEAYIDFGGTSALKLVSQYENLLVVRTFSKSRSMAGMRIGYAIGNRELIQCLNDVKNSYNSYTMNSISIASGVASIEDDDYFKEMLQKVIGTRDYVKTKLEELNFRCTDSKANFLFATHKEIPAREIFEALRNQGIYVRYFNANRIDNYLRISIGTDEEMKQLVDALSSYIANR
jgi:histidinol-phosphate aminotransferase